MTRIIKADRYLSNFVTCLLWLAGAKKKQFKDDDFIFHKKTTVAFVPFSLNDFDISNENQMIKLPKVNTSVLARDFLKDVNELEKWLDKKGYTLRGSLSANDEEIEDFQNDKSEIDRNRVNV
jgi:hypothetical protein